MNSLVATISELFQFVFIEWFGFRRPIIVKPLALTTPKRELLLETTLTHNQNLPANNITAGNVHYVAVEKLPVFLQPVEVFDSVLNILPYGEKVLVVLSSGRWSQIQYENQTGWVLKDGLTSEGSRIKPNFLIGQFYGFDSEETKKLRIIIDDEFSGLNIEQPLEDVEYVFYKLIESNKKIVWPSERPRIAGRWQKILAGKPGVHISIHPVTGAVMETVNNEGVGHLAYVEAVFPDQSLLISEIGVPEEGYYNERTLPYREWRELRPVFIEVA